MIGLLKSFSSWIRGKRRVYEGNGFTVNLRSEYLSITYEDEDLIVEFAGELFISPEGKTYRGIYINEPQAVFPLGTRVWGERLKIITDRVREALKAQGEESSTKLLE